MKLGFIISCWQGLTFDKGEFSTKKTAYVVSVGVTSWIIFCHIPTMTWDLLTAYALHCTGPTSLREYLQFKAGKQMDTTKAEDAK